MADYGELSGKPRSGEDIDLSGRARRQGEHAVMDPGQDFSDPDVVYLRHRLTVVGCNLNTESRRLETFSNSLTPAAFLNLNGREGVILLIQPQRQVLELLGVRIIGDVAAMSELQDVTKNSQDGMRLKALNGGVRYRVDGEFRPLLTCDQDPVWLQIERGGTTIILAGTSISDDLLLFAQGDPVNAQRKPSAPMWGIAGERPVYLYDGITTGSLFGERLADNWVWFIRSTLKAVGVPCADVLPRGLPGIIVVTGDDDQAHLEKYARQGEILGETPITYFLHPLTKHNDVTLTAILKSAHVELGLHPDSLDDPERYPDALKEQSAWFEEFVGVRPALLRNHGFLNNGYWEQAAAWIDNDFVASSNLPGFDGNILNGSLFPSRLMLEGSLLQHWSILTSFGDGMVFAGGYSDREAASRILELASMVKSSGMPGVIVVNLHPQNVEETLMMHEAVQSVLELGFEAWTLGECISWFQKLERPGA